MKRELPPGPITREMLTPELLDALFGTKEERLAETRELERNRQIAESPCNRELYPGEYIAVYGGEVVAHAPTRALLNEQIRGLGLPDEAPIGMARPVIA